MNLVQLHFSYSFSDILHGIHSEVIVSTERQMAGTNAIKIHFCLRFPDGIILGI